MNNKSEVSSTDNHSNNSNDSDSSQRSDSVPNKKGTPTLSPQEANVAETGDLSSNEEDQSKCPDSGQSNEGSPEEEQLSDLDEQQKEETKEKNQQGKQVKKQPKGEGLEQQGEQLENQREQQLEQREESEQNQEERAQSKPQPPETPSSLATSSPQQQNDCVRGQETLGEGSKCWECGAAFQDDVLLRDHLVLFHAEVHTHKCHSCPAVFPSQSTLTKHITTIHLVGASIQSARQLQPPGSQSEEPYGGQGSESDLGSDEEEEESDEEQNLSEPSFSSRGISVSGGNLSLLKAKGISISGGSSISVSGGDSTSVDKNTSLSGSNSALAYLQAKGISISGKDSSSSLKSQGISISGGDSSLSSLQSKGISISGGSSSLTSLQAKGISISGASSSNTDSSLTSLQAKGISISGSESYQLKGVSISGADSSLTSLQAKGISISGADSSLQAKGVSVSSGESSFQLKGVSISGGNSSLTSLQAKGISVFGADNTSFLPKGVSISSGNSSLSSLQAKGISISGSDSSLKAKGVSVTSADSHVSSLLQAKGVSISGRDSSGSSADSTVQGKGTSVSSANSSLSALQAKGISIGAAVSNTESQLSALKEKGISFSPAKSQLTSLQTKGVSLSEKDPLLYLQSKGISLSTTNSLSFLQSKGVSLSASGSQLQSEEGDEDSVSTGSSRPPSVESRGDWDSLSAPNSRPPSVESKSDSLSGPNSPASFGGKGVPLSVALARLPPGKAKDRAVASRRARLAYLQAKAAGAQESEGNDGSLSSDQSEPGTSVSRGSTTRLSYLRHCRYSGCLYCRINRFKNTKEFEEHHLNHVKQTSLKIILIGINPETYKANKVETRRKKKISDLKLKLRISKVGRGRGRKRREVSIVSDELGMSEGHKSLEETEGLAAEQQAEEESTAGSLGEGEGQRERGQSEEPDEEASRSSTGYQRESLEDQSALQESGHDVPDQEQQDYQQEEQQVSGQEESDQHQDQEERQDGSPPPEQEEAPRAYQTRGSSNPANSGGFDNANFSDQDLGFGAAGPSEAPPSTYQPQFESFPTSDWFSEYESGSRIAAAMAGATTAESANEGSWASGSDGTNPSYTTANTDGVGGQNPPNNEGTNNNGEGGLFSQAVLGQESPDKGDRQGSFEQLCLNDAYSGQGQNDRSGQPDHGQGMLTDNEQQQQQQEQQQQQQQQSGVASDLLSELEYLNNSGQPAQSAQSGHMEGSPHSGGPSPHSGGGTPSHMSSRGSNSGTPTSSGGHPTPPPSDTSFRALATSPMNSPTTPTSPASLHHGHTPPTTSPLGLSGDQPQAGVPRLTIANNLMAPTTSNQIPPPPTTTNQTAVGGMMSRYGTQWPQGAGYTGATGYGNLPGTSMPNSNMSGTLRAPLPPSVGMPYRPSPPARVRGRPPLMGQIGRPPLHQGTLLQSSRGPGRPPASSILPPPLMPAPGGRGSMMPPLQRMHQGMYQGQRPPGPQQQNGTGKRPLMGATHSPNKNARREDINVPSRQKDTECQIIAVANRADGLPVISNVQGGSGSNQRVAAAPSSESTINLSDSITLSVRSSANDKTAQRGEKTGGDAGTVANLLASRGITVTPAAGERQEGAGGGRDDRRLPTAQELNLSSAISVHPPTQREREANASRERDRDGFAVPQAPVRSSTSSSSSSSSNSSNSVERPPRPPTVDLTQDVPSSGSQGTRHHCSQCERSFPTAGLLADHSRAHQQHQQSRMPFKCHLCTAGFSSQKGQQHHYQQFHQLHLSAGDIAIPLVDLRNPVNVQRMAALGIRSFLPLTNLQNRGAGGVVGIPVLTLENLRNGHMTLQQWGVSDVLSLGPAKTLNMPR